MAVIRRRQEGVFRLERFSGLNESPSGDASLKLGEAAQLVNFRVTGEGNLQVRPGSRSLWTFDGPVEGMWSGELGGRRVKLAAAGEELWLLGEPGEKESLGRIGPGRCVFFPFAGRLYLLTGKRYLTWNGYGEVKDVAGYRPVVVVSVPPGGGGSLLEGVNRLTGARRGFFSPDGSARTFRLPEGDLSRVDYVRRRSDGEDLPFTADLERGTVTLANPPAAGVNTVEMGWTKGAGQRGSVLAMGWAELFSGAADNRVFLYGDGTNKVVFSGVDYDGSPRGDYFPEGNVLTVGGENSPVTAMIRHYTRLLCFKEEGAWCVQAGSVTGANGLTISAPWVTPIHREVGNLAPGQVRLVNNDPWSLWQGGVYRWSSGSDLAQDERAARRISDRVGESLRSMDLTRAVVFDDQSRQEWYVSEGGVTLVHNYRSDAWYRYEGFTPRCWGLLEGELYFGTAEGSLRRFSRDYRNDDGEAIHALWRSGSMDFGDLRRRRWGRLLWVAMKPESGGCLTVSVRKDRHTPGPRGTIRASLMNYSNANYGHWSFSPHRQPQVKRLKVRPGPGAYEQLSLMSDSASETATVLSLGGNLIQGRYSG